MHAGRLGCLLAPFAALANRMQTSQGQTQNCPFLDAGCIKHTPHADGGLCGHVPTRPGCTTPHIRFLYVAPHVWIGLPPDATSRGTPLPFSSPSAPLIPGTGTSTP